MKNVNMSYQGIATAVQAVVLVSALSIYLKKGTPRREGLKVVHSVPGAEVE